MPQNDGDKIWAAYAKGVKPLGRGKNLRVPSLPSKKEPAPRAQKKNHLLPKKQESVPVAEKRQSVSFDRRTERRLRQGAVEIEARLNLHGMRQEEAHAALSAFIARQVKANRRCLLI